MPRRLMSLIFPACLATPLIAQQPALSLDASFGANRTARRAALSAWQPVLRLPGRILVGAGVRVSVYGGDPASYGNQGTVQGGLAVQVTIDPAVYALNAALFIDVPLISVLALGANLDVVGVAGGPTRTTGTLSAKPQGVCYFRYGSRDHGALNSEFFAAVRVSPRLRIRAGLSHYVTDYLVTDAASAGAPSSRYQRFETAPFVAVRFQR